MSTDPRTARILGLSAVSDLVIGGVLLAVGTTTDTAGLQWGGAALLLVGAVVLAVLLLQRDRPSSPGSP